MRRLAFPVLFLAFLLPTPLRAEEAHRSLRPVLRMAEGGQYLEAVGLLKEVVEVARDPLLRAQGLKVEGDELLAGPATGRPEGLSGGLAGGPP